MELPRRELLYTWYYFSVQLEQLFGWWVLGMLVGSAVSTLPRIISTGLSVPFKGKESAFWESQRPTPWDRVPSLYVWVNPDCRFLF